MQAAVVVAVTAAVVLGSAGPAVAAPPSGCFVRFDDAAHLRKYPHQQVTWLWVRLGSQDDRAVFGMNVWLRGKRQIWRSGGPCALRGEGWMCRPERDAASPLVITGSGAALRLDNPGKLKVFDDLTGPELDDAILTGPGNASFTLRSAAKHFCKDPSE